jgi:hypothetical protein
VDLIEDTVSKLRRGGRALVEQFVDFAVAVCNQYFMVERGMIGPGRQKDLGRDIVDSA